MSGRDARMDYPQSSGGEHSDMEVRKMLDELDRLRAEVARLQGIEQLAITEVDRLRAEVERMKACILDIDAHATPLGEDEDGFVSVGYMVSVGALHRALGAVGHSSAKCKDLDCERAATLRAEVERMRPVIEAAEEWFDEDDALEAVSDWLAAAVARYRASVAALDAGGPAGE